MKNLFIFLVLISLSGCSLSSESLTPAQKREKSYNDYYKKQIDYIKNQELSAQQNG